MEIKKALVKDKDKFLIHKGSGGLCHMLSGLFYAITKSIEMQRILIIDTKTNAGFGKKLSEYFEITNSKLRYSEDYRIIPETLCDIEYFEKIQKPIKLKGNNYTIGNLVINREIDGDCKDPIIMHCGPKPIDNVCVMVKDKISSKFRPLEIKKKYIAIHFRNTDKKNNIDDFVNSAKETMKSSGINTIFLATDDSNAFENFIVKFGEIYLENPINLIQTTKPINNCGKNIHYGNKNKEEMIFNALLDIYLLMKADYFIPSRNSGYSKLIIHLLKKKRNIFKFKSHAILV